MRKRKLPSGNVALFLDYVQNDTRMRESLGLTLYPGTTASIKEKNQRTLLKAEAFRIEKEKENYDLMLFDLKQMRENLKQQEDITNYYNLKMIIKEFYGDQEYKRCIDEMLRRSEAYDIKNTMGIGFYTRRKGEHIRKI